MKRAAVTVRIMTNDIQQENIQAGDGSVQERQEGRPSARGHSELNKGPGEGAGTPQSKIWGAVFLIAGTTLGAGMLAMPLTTASAGFGVTAAGLIIMWAVAYFTAVMFLEVYRHHSPDKRFATLADEAYGKAGWYVITGTMLLYMYGLIAAYTSEGGGLLARTFGLPPAAGVLIFMAFFGLLIKQGVTLLDNANRYLFPVQMAVFAGLLALMLPRVSLGNLSAAPLHAGLALSILPVFMTAYSFHVVLPSMTQYLENDTAALRKAVLFGTGIPMLAYLLWQMAIHGVIPQAQLSGVESLAQLNDMMGDVTGSSLVNIGMELFTGLALVTSFFGIGLSLTDTLRESFPKLALVGEKRGWPILLIALVPPLLVALLAPSAFVVLLSYSGVMAVIFSLLLPVLLVRHARRQGQDIHLPGGNLLLWLLPLIGAVLLLVPLLIGAGVLPEVAS